MQEAVLGGKRCIRKVFSFRRCPQRGGFHCSSVVYALFQEEEGGFQCCDGAV